MNDFVAWQRPAVYALATDPPTSARLAADLPITLHDDDGDLAPAPASFLLAGPGDVANLAGGQITGRRPHPGCIDAEATMMAHVELATPDLPWRYSPQPQAAGLVAVRPWLVLVVGTPAEVTRLADGRVRLTSGEQFEGKTLFDWHPLTDAHRWAHVHTIVDHSPFSRIISPRKLDTGQDYVAALVPCWRAVLNPDGTSTLADSWPGGAGTVTLTCFDSWGFRTTTEQGDFASIAQRLEPLSDDDQTLLAEKQFGRARVTIGPVPGTVLAAGAALTVVPKDGEPPVADPLPADVAATIEALASDLTDAGRWVLTVPRYDVPWHPGPVEGEDWQWPPPGDDVVPDGWRREMRADPRHRGAAGLGAWVAIAWQDRIADGAARQAAAVAAAAQRIRHLTLGLRAARSLWNRRVPTDSLARLATLAPLLGRMPVDGAGSALGTLADRTPALAPALFSSAARRMLRRRGPLARAAQPGATSLPGLIVAANRCPDPQKLSDGEHRILRALADPGSVEHLAGALRERADEVLTQFYDNADTAGPVAQTLREDPHVLLDLLDAVRGEPPVSSCSPLADLGAFADSVAKGIDPTVARPVVVARVLGTIGGLRAPFLAEPDVSPEIDIPLWKFLSDNSPDWLLPGSGDIPPDRVLAVATNPPFVDAVLLGANVQTLGELRWRNLPITTRWTPLRRFWQRVNVAAGGVATDIRPVVALNTDLPLWPDASPLGDLTHLADPSHGANLVVVLHTELFRRYPATLVYLVKNAGGATPWAGVPEVDTGPNPGNPPPHRDYPSFSGTLTPDLVFFGFGVPPSAGLDHWLVLEEPPPGYRFAYTPGDASPEGATFAEHTFDPPVRVFLGNLL
ncbi:hypothetical protein [Pengzhenrongella sp.]|jgi:hypothetical protein|uniref:hypothetical protein n=1 Tax=Pengzhenrongella sp. TaxID=2888820 RepID=UPI002F936481